MARPVPLWAPVTRAVRPARFKFHDVLPFATVMLAQR